MPPKNQSSCDRCGNPIPQAATDNLCPACLLAATLETQTIPLGTILPRKTPARIPSAFGDYKVIRLLGRGGMGSVYEAEHLPTGRRVALKQLGHQLDNPEMRQRFLREGRLAAKINHPNSLYVFGSEEIDGQPVITMEIAGSGTLKDQLDEHGPLPIRQAVDAILDVISGLEAAHHQGVLHRDIKPSNCFLSPDGSVKVGDFGLSVSTLSRSDSFVTTEGKALGTPSYASPEQLRGDELDLRSDIYSVAATLYTLLTQHAPFEGTNAIQVVANAVNQPPTPPSTHRPDIPPQLEKTILRCLQKDPAKRYPDYASLRSNLLPFSSHTPEPAPLKTRLVAGWIDFLIAFLPPYATLMLTVGAAEFHNRPLVEGTLHSYRYYLLFLAIGMLYFIITEGFWGAGLGKRLKNLSVIQPNGHPPGPLRALARIAVPIASIEIIRIPLTLLTTSPTDIHAISGKDITIYILATNICAWIPVLLSLTARPSNQHAALWDLASGTRVVSSPDSTPRPTPLAPPLTPTPTPSSQPIGPYLALQNLAPQNCILATDPLLRRQVWLIQRHTFGPTPSRKAIARPGRLRWLQEVHANDETWDAYEAPQGIPLTQYLEQNPRLLWTSLRHWLHDVALELWESSRDHTLPQELSLQHIAITNQGRAILLDEPWPGTPHPTQTFNVDSLEGQQRFLNHLAKITDPTTIPLHAQPTLENLHHARFEKLSYLTGMLRSLIQKPAEITRSLRAGSVLMLPTYVFILLFLGFYQKNGNQTHTLALYYALLTVILISSITQLLSIPFRCTASQSIFRIAVVNSQGQPASIPQLALRWCLAWLPLLIPLTILLIIHTNPTWIILIILAWLLPTLHTALHPHQGLHDQLAKTFITHR